MCREGEQLMPINSFAELADNVRAIEKKSRIAVVAADDVHTVEAVVNAQKEGLVEALLIGERSLIEQRLDELGAGKDDYEIIDAPSIEESLAQAVEQIHAGRANVLMKGHLETGDFMRAILKKENNLRKGSLLSVAGFYELEKYHKLFVVTDQAINTYPDIEGKKAILENAVDLLHAFGTENPKVAVLAAVEKVNPKMKETVDADALRQMNQKGEIVGCVVDGPLSLDIATSYEAARIKGYESDVAGDADLLLVPDLVCGNVFVKALTGFAGATTAGTVVGARIPVVLTPRSAEASDKFYSIALAAYTAKR
jgi:phosphotransacetylase